MRSEIRVGLLTKGLNRGGIETLLLEQVTAPTSTAISYSVAYCLHGADALAAEISKSCPVALVATSQSRLLFDKRFWRWLRSLDVVHVQNPVVASLVRVIPRRLGRPPIVYTEHQMWGGYNPISRALNRLSYFASNRSFAVSSRVLSSMSERAKSTTEVLIHGITPIPEAEKQSQTGLRHDLLGVEDEDFLFVTVANHRKEKNLPLLIEVADRVKHLNPGATFIHIGAGPLEQENLASNEDAGGPVTFMGHRSDVRLILPLCDAFLLTSDFEGLPVALMEAFSAGLPVISTDSGGVSELVNEANGLLAAPGDKNRLIESCIYMIDNKASFTEGIRATAELVDRGHFIKALEATYKELALADA